MRSVIIAGILFFLLIIASFAGGSAIFYLGGADGLNIDGTASPHGGGLGDHEGGTGWTHYGGDAGGARFNAARAINTENVRDLVTAWEFQTGDLARPAKALGRSASEGTPILAAGALIFCTPFNEIIALDPGTGALKWRRDAQIDLDASPANQFVCRGLAHWRDGASENHLCTERIVMATNDSRIVAVDAATGAPCEDFGVGGVVTVRPETQLLWAGEFQFTSPPVIVGDVVIVGSAISDNARRAAPHGTVRAFNVRTGAAVWSFDPIPRTADAPTRADWPEGAAPVEGHANVWAPMSADLKRGLVFLPTSSPSPDFYGGLRAGDNRHANSVVALEAATGAVRWAYQIVHHDVWDYDLPAQPGLYQVWRDGRRHDVVAQVTKTGHVFVLDRDTGAPFLPIEERPAPQDGQTGEVLSATQPFPVRTPALVPDRIAPGDAFGLTWFDKRACAARIKSADAGGLFTPPSERGALIYPANSGGANWGGAAFDPSRNLLVVNMSNIVHHVQLIAAENVPEMRAVFHDSEVSPQSGAPYGMKREVLVSPLGLPCNPPPWGVIAGVDLASGAIVWRKRFGTTQDLAGGLALPLGTPNFGGPIITSGGLIFIGATMDNYLRAFDIATGAELWKGRLPAGGQATPMTYEWEGRQYVVIYAGGHARAGTRLGDSIVAFALP